MKSDGAGVVGLSITLGEMDSPDSAGVRGATATGVGKALGSLDGGSGVIKMLVMLR